MRATCETLKSIRKQIADANGIAYEPNICTYEGPCMGTCPVCEAEARYLEAELAKRQKAHKGINIIGVAKDKMPAPSSFSQAIAAATITTVLIPEDFHHPKEKPCIHYHSLLIAHSF